MENKIKGKAYWIKKFEEAAKTAKWAKTMIKWAITFVSSDSNVWQFVSFEGSKGGEPKGIVDLIAIRKKFKSVESPLKAGDFFEIILIQAKGGTASKPTEEDKRRLLRVGKYYRANHIVLAEWKKGRLLIFKKLLRNLEWKEIKPEIIFK